MKLYADKELSQPLDVIHLGTVEVGKTSEYEIYAHNPTQAVFENIKLTVDPMPEGLGMGNIPTRLDSGEIIKIRIVWSPPLSMREALTVKVAIIGQEIYYA